MREWINLFEHYLTSRTSVRGSHSGQQDLTLTFSLGSEIIGWIDYVVYNDDVSKHMIHVGAQYRRKGYGTKMLKALQKKYPNTEIDLGMLTDDGAALIRSMSSREIPNGNISALKAEKQRLEDKIASYHARHDELMRHIGEPDFDQRRDAFMANVKDWNDLYDRISDIDDEIGGQRDTKRIFEGRGRFDPANPNVVTVYHGSTSNHHTVHDGQFFTSDPHFAEDYGPHIRKFRLNLTNFADSLDRELIEPLLPLYDPYTDSEIHYWDDYMDRSSDTWEIIEDHAQSIVQECGADGLIIYEGGVKNFIVFNTDCVEEIHGEDD